MQSTVNKPGKLWTWTAWAGVSLMVITLLVFAGLRTLETYGSSAPDNPFVNRYIEHPWVTAIHMVSGIGFVLFAPLQFIAPIRNRYRKFHRVLGRVLVFFAIVAGVYGLVSVVTYPIYGGLPATTAGWFFGPLFLFAVCRAYWKIRSRNIASHREWMIRAFALGLGVGTQRIVIGFFQVFTEHSIYEVFGPALWIGFCFNLLIAEIWINATRLPVKKSSSVANS